MTPPRLGSRVWFGWRLARDLTVPKLRRRWAQAGPGVGGPAGSAGAGHEMTRRPTLGRVARQVAGGRARSPAQAIAAHDASHDLTALAAGRPSSPQAPWLAGTTALVCASDLANERPYSRPATSFVTAGGT